MAKKNNDFFRAPSNVIVDALKESTNRVKELEAKVAKLEKELAKYKTQNREMRQREKSLRGQLSAARSQVSSLQKGLKVQKIRVKRAVAAQKKAEAETAKIKTVIKNIKPKLTREQVFEAYRQTNTAQFWQRVLSMLEFTQEQITNMQQKMNSWSSQTLRDVIRIGNLRRTYYDSTGWESEVAAWESKGEGLSGEMFYVFFMSY